ncbi:hypothetical protein, partial [Streptomyces sp. NPDC048277]|uniref:hypothetical protein n=1 Tax=Streptomyces sp. NPDC048277 TaxID=3155027 RepID=UPI0033E741CB
MTDFLREFLTSDMSMHQFADTKEIPHSTAARWSSGGGVPGGRNGLSKDEQEELEKRLAGNRKGDTRRDAAYVTGFLQEFLTSDMSMREFAKKKGISKSTASHWASGGGVPEGRNGLSKDEQEELDKRKVNRGSRSNAQSFVYSSYQQDPAYGPPGLSQAGASAANPYLVSGMPTTT